MRKSGEIKFVGKNSCRISAKNIFHEKYFLNACSTRNQLGRFDFSVGKVELHQPNFHGRIKSFPSFGQRERTFIVSGHTMKRSAGKNGNAEPKS